MFEAIKNLFGKKKRFIFFPDEPDRDKTERYVEWMMVETMEKAGWDPELIYAFKKTGRVVTRENRHLLSEEDLEEWQEAIDEYREQHEGG